MSKFKWSMNLQLFSEEVEAVESGVESVPAAEEQAVPEGVTSSESGVDTEVAAEPEKQNNFEKAFAKRLAAKEAEWQAKIQEMESRYKDYETHKELSEYFQQINGADAMTLKERIEMERLQERADQHGITPEMQKRLEALEAKAAKADELEREREEESRVQSYFTSLNDFVKDKGIEADKLNQFMIDNGLSYDPNDPNKSFNLAFKAMRADELEQKLATAEEDAIKKYLASKSAPRVEGTGTPGVVQEDTSKMSWNELRQRAISRIQATEQST